MDDQLYVRSVGRGTYLVLQVPSESMASFPLFYIRVNLCSIVSGPNELTSAICRAVVERKYGDAQRVDVSLW